MTKRPASSKKKKPVKPTRAKSRKTPAKVSKSSRKVSQTSSKSGSGAALTGKATSLNDTDRQLLGLMQQDARLSNLALAKAVGLSPAACHERVRKLVTQGWITEFNAQLNAQALGQGLVVFVDLALDPAEPKALEALQKVVDRSAQIMECHRVAGDTDIMLKVRCRDLETYRDILDNSIMPIRGVHSAKSRISLATLKQTNRIAL